MLPKHTMLMCYGNNDIIPHYLINHIIRIPKSEFELKLNKVVAFVAFYLPFANTSGIYEHLKKHKICENISNLKLIQF